MSLDISVLQANARALARQQQSIHKALIELSNDDVSRLKDIEIPKVSRSDMRAFAESAVQGATGDCLVLLGLSSPQLLADLQEHLRPDQALIVLEPTLTLAIRLLSSFEFSEVFGKDYSGLVIGNDDRSLREQMEFLVADWGLNSLQLVVNPMRPFAEEIPQRVADLLQTAVDAVEISSAMSARYGIPLVDSIVSNLELAIQSPSLNSIRHHFEGKPAFLVGAGPSLDRDIEMLTTARERGTIICVDAALPVLLDAGITPDLVTCIDVIDAKSKIFRSYDTTYLALIGILSTHRAMLDAWKGEVCLLADAHPLAQWAAPLLPQNISLPSLGNVSHLSLIAASVLGADPIVLVGTDFSYSRGGQTYASGVIHQPTEIIDGTSPALDNTTQQILSNDGKSVSTHRNMPMYVATMEALIAASNARVLNASTEGAKIAGAQYQPLYDVLESLERIETQERPFRFVPANRDNIASRKSALLKDLGHLAGELRAYAADALSFVDSADLANRKISKEELSAEEALRLVTSSLNRFGRHKGVIDLLDPMQPAVSYEIARLTRRTRGIDDPVERTKRRILALAGPAKSGSRMAEHLADRLTSLRAELQKG